MYEDLIENIKNIIIHKPLVYKEFIENDTIERVINIIKQAEPRITDMPLEEGWHYVYSDGVFISCIEVYIHEQDGCYFEQCGVKFCPDDIIKSKWQKIPEPKGVCNV